MKQALKRQALTKPNLTYLRWRYVGNGGRTLNAMRRAPVYDDAPHIADELKDRGIVVATADQYLDQEGQRALAQASDLVLSISRRPETQAALSEGHSLSGKDYLVQRIPWDYKHGPDSPLVAVALDEKLLEIVSLYLGMWPRLHAIGAWLNFPSPNAPKQAQLWHRDPEDIKIIKV